MNIFIIFIFLVVIKKGTEVSNNTHWRLQ